MTWNSKHMPCDATFRADKDNFFSVVNVLYMTIKTKIRKIKLGRWCKWNGGKILITFYDKKNAVSTISWNIWMWARMYRPVWRQSLKGNHGAEAIGRRKSPTMMHSGNQQRDISQDLYFLSLWKKPGPKIKLEVTPCRTVTLGE